MHCGRPGPFRDATALRCTRCDATTELKRKDYQREYQKAKASAMRLLVKRHSEEFDQLLIAERIKQRQLKKSGRAS